MSAGGNDFIILDNVGIAEEDAVTTDPEMVRRLCSRALSVGADGLIVLESPEKRPAHVRMVYFNSDGGRADLCGNGVRCVARLAALKRLAPADGMLIETDAGTLQASVEGDRARFRLPLGAAEVQAVALLVEEFPGASAVTFSGSLVNVGVPHLVVEVDDAHGMSSRRVMRIAPLLRSHPDLGPEGANVDFITVSDRESLDIRCYERGVEAETISSGTGCIAAALVARHLGQVGDEVAIRSRAGITSTVRIEAPEGGEVSALLSGDARIIYNAVLNIEALSGWQP